MTFSWLPWHRSSKRKEDRQPEVQRQPRSCRRAAADSDETSALPRSASIEAPDDEATSSYQRPREKPALCRLEDVAIVTAVLAGEDAAAFESLVEEGCGVFSAAKGAREERLRALSALRTRSAPTRKTMISPEEVPPWARGRLPASASPLGSCSAELCPGARQAVDAALGARISIPGPGFGSWCPPAVVIEVEVEA